MDINRTVLVIVGVVLVASFIFLIARNRKDEKELEQTLNEDYPKPKEAEHTDDPDDIKGS